MSFDVLSWARRLWNGRDGMCALCHDLRQVSDGICAACFEDLAECVTDGGNSCPLCFRYLAGGAVCGACQNRPVFFDRMWASLYYEPPVSGMIRHLKHLSDLGMVRPLVGLMRKNPPVWLDGERFDWVLPVPLSRKRRFFRGFNQSEELAALLAEHYRWNILPHRAVFRRHKPPQSTLKSRERLKNIKNVFDVDGAPVQNCNILLIDDVFTTGSTLNELARTLKKSGANRVCCWSLARPSVKK